jgi:hypothetical protein
VAAGRGGGDEGDWRARVRGVARELACAVVGMVGGYIARGMRACVDACDGRARVAAAVDGCRGLRVLGLGARAGVGSRGEDIERAARVGVFVLCGVRVY